VHSLLLATKSSPIFEILMALSKNSTGWNFGHIGEKVEASLGRS
jgi:hypothetical protein